MSWQDLNTSFQNEDPMFSGKHHRVKSLSFNVGSSKSLDKFALYDTSSATSTFLSNGAINKACMDEFSDDDLMETQSTPSNFKNTRYKNPKLCKNFNKKSDIENFEKMLSCKDNINKINEVDTVIKDADDPFKINVSTAECEETNIEQCLLDLDDYLEKMDKNLPDNTNDLNKDKSIAKVSKHVYSSIREKNNSEKETQFERSSRLRNTISCTSDKGKFEYKDEDWHKNINQFGEDHNIYSRNKNLDLNNELPQCSLNIHKPKSFENTNILRDEDTTKTSINNLQILTDETIFQNIIEQQEASMQNNEHNAPRQFGRRFERVLSLASTLSNGIENSEYLHNDFVRPLTAPASTAASIPEMSSHNGFVYGVSDGSTTRTSRNTSLVSIESSTDSGESVNTSNNVVETSNNVNDQNNDQGSQLADSENVDSSIKYGFNSHWPHNYSRTLALISCTLGLLNISRFAVLTINFGGNFLIQFLILSVIFGIPFLWLQMSLGAKINAGPINMWKISPICIGIGIALTLVQYIFTIYSSVVVAWILVYIEDIVKNHSSYPWSESNNYTLLHRSSYINRNLTESIPDYFNLHILKRLYIFSINDGDGIRFHISDRVSFYLIILWAVMFLMLCKGLRSFGKMIFFLGFLPITLLTVIAVKMLFVVNIAKLQNIFSSTEFDEFLINSKTWAAAAQEAFLTWGILGASVVAMSSRTHRKSSKHTLRGDAILVVLVTLIGLCLSALIGLCSIQILNENGYVYVPGSYETSAHYSAIYSLKSSSLTNPSSFPTKFTPHYSALVGEVYRRHTDIRNVSGYQVLRFVTEILPATLSVSNESISWIWALFVFITFLMFGVSQLCVMWKPISCALGNSTSAVLLSCVSGLLLSIPFATEIGITLLHYMDILLGGAWFIPILWVAEIFGVFLIRGRPYNGDDLVNDLKMSASISAFLALSWNVLLPIGLITLAVIEYKISLSSQLYYWRGKSYFNYWSRKVGALTQIGFLLLVPISAIVQIYRYLSSGPPDILDRIQLLYRPFDGDNVERNRNVPNPRYRENNENSNFRHFQDDAPPKYTPPPSYTTATGARLAKMLRQSLRRSVRRIMGESERIRTRLSIQHETQNDEVNISPDYTANRSESENELDNVISESIEVESRPAHNSFYGRSLSLGRKQLLNKRALKEDDCRPLSTRENSSNYNRVLKDRPYTAEDVLSVLRSSTLGRRRTTNQQSESIFRSIENLVENAEPPNISSTIMTESKQNNQNSTTVM